MAVTETNPLWYTIANGLDNSSGSLQYGDNAAYFGKG